jgi:hypothetical protein
VEAMRMDTVNSSAKLAAAELTMALKRLAMTKDERPAESRARSKRNSMLHAGGRSRKPSCMEPRPVHQVNETKARKTLVEAGSDLSAWAVVQMTEQNVALAASASQGQADVKQAPPGHRRCSSTDSNLSQASTVAESSEPEQRSEMEFNSCVSKALTYSCPKQLLDASCQTELSDASSDRIATDELQLEALVNRLLGSAAFCHRQGSVCAVVAEQSQIIAEKDRTIAQLQDQLDRIGARLQETERWAKLQHTGQWAKLQAQQKSVSSLTCMEFTSAPSAPWLGSTGKLALPLRCVSPSYSRSLDSGNRPSHSTRYSSSACSQS